MTNEEWQEAWMNYNKKLEERVALAQRLFDNWHMVAQLMRMMSTSELLNILLLNAYSIFVGAS